jgi:4-hydroxybenzoate polyprenyltransferase
MTTNQTNVTAGVFTAAQKSRMSAPAAWALAARPPIVLLSAFGASTGYWNLVTHDQLNPPLASFLLTLVGAAFLGAGIMIHNDYTDAKSDAALKPYKPIPRGIISLNAARSVGLGLMALAVVLGAATRLPFTGALNWRLAAFTLLVAVIGVYYNHYGKKHGLWGHAAVAFGVGAIPYWGGLAIAPNDLVTLFPLAFSIFVMEIGREILVCVGDWRGDLAAGFRTTPLALGLLRATKLAVWFYLAYLVLLFIPYLQGGFGLLYLVGALFFAAVLFITWYRMLRAVQLGDEALIEQRGEVDLRIGTRAAVLLLQVLLLVEAFV